MEADQDQRRVEEATSHILTSLTMILTLNNRLYEKLKVIPLKLHMIHIGEMQEIFHMTKKKGKHS